MPPWLGILLLVGFRRRRGGRRGKRKPGLHSASGNSILHSNIRARGGYWRQERTGSCKCLCIIWRRLIDPPLKCRYFYVLYICFHLLTVGGIYNTASTPTSSRCHDSLRVKAKQCAFLPRVTGAPLKLGPLRWWLLTDGSDNFFPRSQSIQNPAAKCKEQLRERLR